MPATRSMPARHLLLIKSGSFVGWACSNCSWRWRREDRTNDSDQILAFDPMREAFDLHRCEDVAGNEDVARDKAHPVRSRTRITAWIVDIRTEERIASLIAAASMVWTVDLVTDKFAGLAGMPAIPQELTGTCAIATLIWIHAKWRRAVQTGLIQEPLRLGIR